MNHRRHSRESKHAPEPVAAESARIEPRPLAAQAQQAAPDVQPHVAPAVNAGHDFGQVQSPATPLRIQAKLTVSQPGDQYEQEAERVAVSEVRQLDANAGGDQAQVNAQAAPSAQPLVQRSAISGMPVAPDTEQAVQAARGGGQALPAQLGQQMNAAFGTDFGGLHIHTDQRADTLNRALNARAFTTGPDVFFRQGEYQPDSRAGQELLAHELTHVVQQGGRPSIQRAVGDEVEAPEAEVEEAAPEQAAGAGLDPA